MSLIADSKKNWLDQVKVDAEAITRERLAKGKVRIEQVAETINDTSTEKKAKKESK